MDTEEFYTALYSPKMIREPGNPKRIDTPLRNVKDLKKFVDRCKGNKPAFMSIYSYKEDYRVTYENGNRQAIYPGVIFDRIILDFDIPKEELLKKEGYNLTEIKEKGVETLLNDVEDSDEKEIKALTKGKKTKEKADIIRDFYYKKYTSSEYLIEPYKEAIKVYEYLESLFNVKSLLYFSGGHGIHLHIYFNPLDIDNVDDLVKDFGTKLKKELNLKTLDESVISSVHQHLIRIPLSRHQITKLYVIPFNKNTSYFEVLDNAIGPGINVNIEDYINQDTQLLEDWLYSYSDFLHKNQKDQKSSSNLEYTYTLNGSVFDLQEPFGRIYKAGQRNLTAYPLLHFFKGAGIPKENSEEFIKGLPGGNGLDKNEQNWVNTAYSTNKPYQDNMGHLVNTIKKYASNEDEAKYIIKKFNDYFNTSKNIPGEVVLYPGLVQFQNNQYYKDGIYSKFWNKDKEEYDYVFKGNILIHELNTTYDILGEFNPVTTIKYTNTTINKTLTIEDKSFGIISQKIHKAQLIDTNSQGIESILRKISIHSVNKQLSSVKVSANEDLFMTGFFYDVNHDRILHNNEFNNLESSKEDVKSAIRLANELISNRDAAKLNDCTVFRCMLWSPYSYALKQLGFNKSLYGLVLWGVRDTNKTGSCENWSYLYSNPNIIRQDADTPSAFGSRLGENTYNLLVDESFNLLSNKENEETLKKAITNTTVRAVKNKYDNDKIDEYPGLRIPIFTLNPEVEVIKKEEFKKRYKILYYDKSMVLSRSSITQFIKKYKPESPDSPLNQLKHLGNIFASKFEVYLNEKSNELHDLEKLTVDILQEIAEEYDEPFDAAFYTIQEFDIDNEDLGDVIRNGLNRLFFKIHKTYGYAGIVSSDFEFTAKYGEISWLDYQPKNEKYVIHIREFLKEVSNIAREHIPIEDVFDYLNITLDKNDNKDGFKTYTKFKGRSLNAIKISEFDLTYKMFGIDIYEDGKAEEKMEHDEKLKKKKNK